MRITAEQHQRNEVSIRAAIDRLLAGQIPPGGRCDVKTLAREADVDRTAFYGTRPYAHLREEFERRCQALRTAGDRADPRDAQITRLKTENAALTQRLARRDQAVAELTDLNAQALSRIAAQHEEITQLRRHTERGATIRRLPTPPGPAAQSPTKPSRP